MTTDQTVPDAAVKIVDEVIASTDAPFAEQIANDVLASLARAGWLHDPARVAALEAVAETAEDVSNWLVQADEGHPALDDLCAALGSLPNGNEATR